MNDEVGVNRDIVIINGDDDNIASQEAAAAQDSSGVDLDENIIFVICKFYLKSIRFLYFLYVCSKPLYFV